VRPVGIVVAASALHVLVAATTGLGDAEALYAQYARHLQGGYVDHPPAIGVLVAATTWALGPSPLGVRAGPIVLFPMCAALVFAITRRIGGSDRAASIAVGAYVAIPMLLASGVAASPDAPLAFAWLLSLYAILRSEREPAWTAVAGLAAGLALLSKYSGAWLLAGVVVWGTLPGRRLRAAVVVGLAFLCFVPVLLWNADHDWVSARHRLVWTQLQGGLSLRNAGALLGGQLAYVSPVALVGLLWAASRGMREGAAPGVRLLATSSVVALGIGYGLCLVSVVAEPHWPAPGYLGLVPVLGLLADREWPRVRRWVRIGALWSATVVVVLLLAIWSPLPVHLPGYDGRWDLTNDLRGWPAVAAAVRRIGAGGLPVVAFHYTTCSQTAFALGEGADRVHCLSEPLDDFDLWDRGGLPPGAPAIAIEDPRFDRPRGHWARQIDVPLWRGGVVVRRFAVRLGRLSSTAP